MVRITMRPIVDVSAASDSVTARRRARVITRMAINIWVGPMWKLQILDGAIMRPSIVSTSASAPAQMRSWLPRLVRTSWHEPAIMFFVTRCRSISNERLACKEIRFWLGL